MSNQIPMMWNSERKRFVFYSDWTEQNVMGEEVKYMKDTATDSCTIGLLRKIIKPRVYKRTAGCLVHDALLGHGFTSEIARNEMMKIHVRYGVGFIERAILFAGVLVGDAFFTLKGDRKNNKRVEW